jgi:hypothetical protein
MDRDTLAARYGAARRQCDAGDPVGAVAEFAQLLVDVQRVFGPDNPLALAVRYRHAMSRGEAGDIEAAIVELESLYIDQCRVLGAGDRETMKTPAMIAHWRWRTGGGGSG